MSGRGVSSALHSPRACDSFVSRRGWPRATSPWWRQGASRAEDGAAKGRFLGEAGVPRDIRGTEHGGDAPSRFSKELPQALGPLPSSDDSRRARLAGCIHREADGSEALTGWRPPNRFIRIDSAAGACTELAREPCRFVRREGPNRIQQSRFDDVMLCQHRANLPGNRGLSHIPGRGVRHHAGDHESDMRTKESSSGMPPSGGQRARQSQRGGALLSRAARPCRSRDARIASAPPRAPAPDRARATRRTACADSRRKPGAPPARCS